MRTSAGSTPVPKEIVCVCADAAPRVPNASVPVTSATQKESYPNCSAWRARSTAVLGPDRMNGAAVTPIGASALDRWLTTQACDGAAVLSCQIRTGSSPERPVNRSAWASCSGAVGCFSLLRVA